jgi:diguanylate cyclase (GGDEF)-like protein
MPQTDKQIIVQAGQYEHLLAFSARTTFSNTFLAVVLAYMLSEVLPQLIVISWLACLLLQNIIRFFIGQYFLKHPVKDPKHVSRRLNVFRIGVILNALIWGSIITFTFGEVDIEYALFVVYVFTGLSAGAAVVYSIDRISAFAFLFLGVAPLVIGYTFVGDSISIGIAVIGYFYILYMISSVISSNKSLVEALVLRMEAIKNAEEIKKLAFYDVLTGLPNRRLLLDRLKQSLLSYQRTGKRGAVLYLDVDYFKKLNDTLGHDAGDMLLEQVAERLKHSVRESDTVSRFGGDEFVVILENLHEDYHSALKEVDKVTKQIHANLNQPHQLLDTKYTTTSSIGVALYGEHGNTENEILKNADSAMYKAKGSGRNAVRVCNHDMNSQSKQESKTI